MKRMLAVLLSLMLIAGAIAGCEDQDISVPSIQEESAQPLQSDVNPQFAAYKLALEPLAKSGILFSNWTSAKDIAPDSLVLYCAYSLNNDQTQQYMGSDGMLAIPGEVVESFLKEKFYGENGVVRNSAYYNSTDNIYAVPSKVEEEFDLDVISVVNTLNTFVTVNQMAAGGTSVTGRTNLEIDEDVGGRFIFCLYEENPPERESFSENAIVNGFLRNLTDNATNQIFRVAGLIRSHQAEQGTIADLAFGSAAALSDDDLLRFYLVYFTRNNIAMNEAFDDQDGFYHIPVKAITDYLDKYLDDYTFQPEKVSLGQSVYVQAGQEILLPAGVGYDPGIMWYQTAKQQPVVKDDTVILTAEHYKNGEDGQSPVRLSTDRLTLKITSDGYRYVSLEVEPAAVSAASGKASVS